MSISHIVPNRYYTARMAWELTKDDLFDWGFKRFMIVLKQGHNGVAISWTKGKTPNSAYHILGQDIINFHRTVKPHNNL